MLSKCITSMMVLILIVMVNPGYGKPEDLGKKSMDDLTQLELRLKKVLAIRRLEANISSALKKDESQTTSKESKGPLGMDSTTLPPANQITKVKTVPIPPLPKPVVPKVSKSVRKKTQPLPKIVSIKGEVGKLYAQLEVRKKGMINVKEGDKILNNTYTVTSINYIGVIVKDKKGKAHVLGFKPFEEINRSDETVSDSTTSLGNRSMTFGIDSTYMPPLPE